MRGFWRTVIAMVKDLQQEHLHLCQRCVFNLYSFTFICDGMVYHHSFVCSLVYEPHVGKLNLA